MYLGNTVHFADLFSEAIYEGARREKISNLNDVERPGSESSWNRCKDASNEKTAGSNVVRQHCVATDTDHKSAVGKQIMHALLQWIM